MYDRLRHRYGRWYSNRLLLSFLPRIETEVNDLDIGGKNCWSV